MLLATITQVVALGLYLLFVDPDLPVPRWLHAGDVDDLKARLGGNRGGYLLDILFLEEVIHWGSERDRLPFGLAIAAVVAALSTRASPRAVGGEQPAKVGRPRDRAVLRNEPRLQTIRAHRLQEPVGRCDQVRERLTSGHAVARKGQLRCRGSFDIGYTAHR